MARPSISLSLRTSSRGGIGTAFVDLSGTTCSGVSSPFRDLIYKIDFGSNDVAFANVPSADPSVAWSPVACAVYTTAGTHRIRIWVGSSFDAKDIDYLETSITVTALSGTVEYFSTSGDDTTGMGTEILPYKTSGKAFDRANAVNGAYAALFLAGDSWTGGDAIGASKTLTNTGHTHFGVWGTGDKPHFDSTTGIASIAGSGGFSIQGLSFDRGATSDNVFGGAPDDLLVHQCKFVGYNTIITKSLSGYTSGVVFADNECDGQGTYAIYTDADPNSDGQLNEHYAVIGNDFHDQVIDALRMRTDKSCYMWNLAQDGGTTSSAFRVIGQDATVLTKAQYNVIADNTFDHSVTTVYAIQLGASNNLVNAGCDETLIERNLFTQDETVNAAYGIDMRGECTGVTIRNNRFWQMVVAINASGQQKAGLVYDDVLVQGNSAFRDSTPPGASGNFNFIADSKPVTGLVLRNNAIDAPDHSAGQPIFNLSNTTPGELTADHNIIGAGSADSDILFNVNGTTYSFTSWLAAGYGWGTGSDRIDPLFTDSSNADFTLNDLSPCIDAGQLAYGVDAIFNRRVDLIAELTDIGALEYESAAYAMEHMAVGDTNLRTDRRGLTARVELVTPIDGDVWYAWYVDGGYVALTRAPNFAVNVAVGETMRVTCFATSNRDFDAVAFAPAGYPCRYTIEFQRSADSATIGYTIQQDKDGAGYADIAIVRAYGDQWNYQFRTPVLVDGSTYDWKILPFDDSGNPGTSLTVPRPGNLVVCTPTPTEFSLTDLGSGNIQIAEVT